MSLGGMQLHHDPPYVGHFGGRGGGTLGLLKRNSKWPRVHASRAIERASQPATAEMDSMIQMAIRLHRRSRTGHRDAPTDLKAVVGT